MSNPPKLCAPDLRAAIQPASPEKEPLVPLKIHGKRMFSALFSSDHITVEEMEGPWVDARPSSAEPRRGDKGEGDKGEEVWVEGTGRSDSGDGRRGKRGEREGDLVTRGW